jgi:hypothetical protein
MVRYLSALALLACAGVANAQFVGTGPSPEGQIGGQPDVDEYKRDDGTIENSIGFNQAATAVTDFAWMQKYTVTAGQERITHIRAAFGSPLTMNGRPVVARLWSDPNNDGNPTDAQSIASVPGVILGAQTAPPVGGQWGAPTFVTFDIPDTDLAVGQNFFVGIHMNLVGPGFPAAVDQTPPLPGPGIQWAAFASPGPLNPNAMVGVTDISTIAGLGGDWLVRANAVPIPEPTSMALLGVAGLLGLRRRR